jgi:hypothetical protein
MREIRPRKSPTVDRNELNGVQKNTIMLKKPSPIEAPAMPRAIGESVRAVPVGTDVGAGACSKVIPLTRRTKRAKDNSAPASEHNVSGGVFMPSVIRTVRNVLLWRFKTSSLLSQSHPQPAFIQIGD